MSYDPTGPFTSGAGPGIDAPFLNEVERSLGEDFVLRQGGSFRGYMEAAEQLPSSGSVTVDFSESNVWEVDPDGDIEVVFGGLPPDGYVTSATLILHNTDHDVSFPSGTEFPEGELDLEGKTYLSIFTELDGTVVVSPALQDVS